MDYSICVHKIKLMIFKISKQLTSNIVGALNVLARGIHGKNASHQIAS